MDLKAAPTQNPNPLNPADCNKSRNNQRYNEWEHEPVPFQSVGEQLTDSVKTQTDQTETPSNLLCL
jgi:hypothetical protein